MNLYKLFLLFQDVVDCRNNYLANEKQAFILGLRQVLTRYLPQFEKMILPQTDYNLRNAPPYLVVEIYETTDEIFEEVRRVIYNAAYVDTPGGYNLMQLALAGLYTPVMEKKA